jgi:cation transport ATPase
MAEIAVKIEGMSCGHCVMNTNKSLDALDGVISSEVGMGVLQYSTKTLCSPWLILRRLK